MNLLIIDSSSLNYRLIFATLTAQAEQHFVISKVSELTAHALLDSGCSEAKDNIPFALQQLLLRAAILPKDLNYVITVTGPGSYTGLRMGLSVANAMLLCGSVKVVGVSWFLILKKYLLDKKEVTKKENLLLLLPNNKGGWFAQFFTAEKVQEPFNIDLDSEGQHSFGSLYNHLSSFIKAIRERGIKVVVHSAEESIKLLEWLRELTQKITVLPLDHKELEAKELISISTSFCQCKGTHPLSLGFQVGDYSNETLQQVLSPLYIKGPRITVSRSPLSK